MNMAQIFIHYDYHISAQSTFSSDKCFYNYYEQRIGLYLNSGVQLSCV